MTMTIVSIFLLFHVLSLNTTDVTTYACTTVQHNIKSAHDENFVEFIAVFRNPTVLLLAL